MAPFDDQPWNEMKFNRLYESICVRFLKGFRMFPMEFPIGAPPNGNNSPKYV